MLTYSSKTVSDVVTLDPGDLCEVVSIQRVATASVYTIDVSFHVDVLKASQAHARAVTVALYTKQPTLLIRRMPGIRPTTSDQVLLKAVAATSTSSLLTKYRVTETRVPALGSLNYSDLEKISQGVPLSEIPALHSKRVVSRLVADSNMKADEVPVLEKTVLKSDQESAIDPQYLMRSMIVKGVDPSHIAHMDHPSLSAIHSTGGTLSPRRSAHDDVVTSYQRKLRDHLVLSDVSRTTNDVSNAVSVGMLEDVVADSVRVTKRLVFTSAKLIADGTRQNDLFVLITVFDKSGKIIDIDEMSFSLSTHELMYYTPRKPPIVEVHSAGNRSFLSFVAGDALTRGVDLYLKKINASADMSYEFIERIPFTNARSSMLSVATPITAVHLYRAVPYNEMGNVCHEFTNVVLSPRAVFAIDDARVSVIQRENRVDVEVRNLAADVTSLQLQVKNVVTSTASDIGPRVFVEPQQDVVTLFDSTTKSGSIYEYSVRMYKRNGTSCDSQPCVLKLIRPEPERVQVVISDQRVAVDGDVPHVSFSVSAPEDMGDIEVVRQLLSERGILSMFSDELLKNKEQLKNVLAFNVQSINLTSGERVDYGVIPPGTFDTSQIPNVKHLQFGSMYRFEVMPIIRDVASILNMITQKTDVVTNKAYMEIAEKYLHPLHDTGLITTSQGRMVRFAHHEMMFGVIGDVTTTDVDLTENISSIESIDATRVDRDHVVVTWRLTSSGTSIDQFIVIKVINGVRTIIGKSHNISSSTSGNHYRFEHVLTKHDVGTINYVVVPIMSDYTLGAFAEASVVV